MLTVFTQSGFTAADVTIGIGQNGNPPETGTVHVVPMVASTFYALTLSNIFGGAENDYYEVLVDLITTNNKVDCKAFVLQAYTLGPLT